MAYNSAIEWTDATWNIITGCMIKSPGCTNCYAMKLAGGRLQNHPSRVGLTQPSDEEGAAITPKKGAVVVQIRRKGDEDQR